jgi:hypothetical protein
MLSFTQFSPRNFKSITALRFKTKEERKQQVPIVFNGDDSLDDFLDLIL